MIAGLCESPLTFQAIIIWRDELNDGKVLLRDIIDLEATYAGPDGKGAPKTDATASPCDGMNGAAAAPVRSVNRRAPTAPRTPPEPLSGEDEANAESFDDDDMENSVSLSAMEAELKPKVLETFDRVADAYKKLRRLQDQNVEGKLQQRGADAGAGPQVQGAQERDRRRREVAVAQPEPHRCAGRAALRHQQAPHRPRDAPDAPGRRPWRRPRGLPEATIRAASSTRSGCCASPSSARKGWKDFVAQREGPHQGPALRHSRAGDRDGPRDPRIPQDRPDGAEGRARGPAGEEGNGRGEPSPRHLHRQEIHQPRPAIPRPDPGRQHRPDEGGRQVRVSPRLQVLDLRDVVDPPGDHALASPTRRARSAFPCT